MKNRPRRIENRVAEEMSKFYESIDMSPVVRIPVLGRTGPDISLNELNLAIDVKSRKSCPKKLRAKKNEIVFVPFMWVGCRLDDIHLLLQDAWTSQGTDLRAAHPSKMIQDWLDHMDEWSQEQTRDVISGIVIHNPGNQVKSAMLIVKQWEVFRDRSNRSSN